MLCPPALVQAAFLEFRLNALVQHTQLCDRAATDYLLGRDGLLICF